MTVLDLINFIAYIIYIVDTKRNFTLLKYMQESL